MYTSALTDKRKKVITQQTNTLRSVTVVIGVCAFFAATYGLYSDIYTDHPWAVTQLFGQDVVTIILSFLLIFLSFTQIAKAKLLQAGLLGYFAYTYTTYVFGPALNYLFILYVVLMSSSVLALILIFNYLSGFRIEGEADIVFRATSVYLFLVALILAVLWICDIFATLRGSPLLKNPTGKPFLTVYALDLGFVVPVSVYAAITLWRRRSIGYLLSGFMLVQMTTVGSALIAMTIALYLFDYEMEWLLITFWGFLGTIGLFLILLFLQNINFSLCSTNVH